MIKDAFDKFSYIEKKNIKGAHFLIIFSYDCNFHCVYCYEKNLHNFGKKWMQNKMRVHHNRENTFDKIVKNIELALSKGVKVSLRGNINEKNIKETEDLYKFLKEKGFIDNKNFKYFISSITDINLHNEN